MPSDLKIAIAAQTRALLGRAKALASKLALPIVPVASKEYAYLLVVTQDNLQLRMTRFRAKPLYVDFVGGKLAYRRKFGGGKRQLLAKAVGIKPKITLNVLDATAGLGKDAFILASLGCKVIAIERSTIIAALLQDGLERAGQYPDFADISLVLVITNAVSYMHNLTVAEYPDVVYLDPMYPKRLKSALPKQEMRIMRDIVGEDEDVSQLLAAALQVAKKRVVVKRPRLVASILGPKPNLQFIGKSSRFDVYW